MARTSPRTQSRRKNALRRRRAKATTRVVSPPLPPSSARTEAETRHRTLMGDEGLPGNKRQAYRCVSQQRARGTVFGQLRYDKSFGEEG